MFITIDENDERPVYRQVADEIRTLIANGTLKDGSPMPPVRQLAADLGVNLNTVAAAYRELQAAGLVTVKHGSGATVTLSKPAPDEAQLRRKLRAMLTEMVLAGHARSEILTIVGEELRGLMKGAR